MTAPTLTDAQLNRATLARQLLLERSGLTVPDAVRAITAIQAQAPPSPYLALQARLRDFDPADLDAALGSGDLVKATLMRITLHLVHAADHQDFQHAMTPTLRAARLGDRRVTESGINPERIDAVLPAVLAALREPHGNADAIERVSAELGVDGTWAWWAIRHLAPVRHHPGHAVWGFGDRPVFVATEVPPLAGAERNRADEALGSLVRRYLAGFGPASIADMAQFAMVQRGRLRPVLAKFADELVHYRSEAGAELFDLPELPGQPVHTSTNRAAIPDGNTPAPARLLPMWDSTMLAYHDRSRILPEPLRRTVIRTGGDTLPTVLVDGYVAGVWRSIDVSGRLRIEVTSFTPLDAHSRDEIEAEADRILRLLATRQPEPYRRYHRWWGHLPATEVHLF